MNLVREL
jgi:dihydrofolate reductase